MTRDLAIGYSPCPNDTFMFHGWVSGAVQVPGVRPMPVLDDIEGLNRRALGDDPLPVTKLSVGVLAAATSRYAVLGAGAALGRGCGPLVVGRSGGELAALAGRTVAIPGDRTTAFLLLRIFGPAVEPVVLRYDQIMPAVAAGTVDAGLIIHESRFTYPDHGLKQIADLGVLWEADTGMPLPLGVIAARRELGSQLGSAIEDGLRRSIEVARADPSRGRGYVRQHAQELSDAVCDQHITLYVNEHSVNLGVSGRAAIEALLARGRAVGALPQARSPWWDG